MEVLDNAREHIMDGVVFETPDGVRRFVDAPEVARTAERGVTLTIPAAEAGAAAAAGASAAEARRRRVEAPVRRAPGASADLEREVDVQAQSGESRGDQWLTSRRSRMTTVA